LPQSEASRPINSIIGIKIDDATPKKRLSFDLEGTDSFDYVYTISPVEPGGHFYFHISIRNSHTKINNGRLFLQQFECPIVKQIKIVQYTFEPPVTQVVFKIPKAIKPQIKAIDNHLKIVFGDISTEENAFSLMEESAHYRPLTSKESSEQLRDKPDSTVDSESKVSSQPPSATAGKKNTGMIFIIIILSIILAAVTTIFSIHLFLRKGTANGDKKNTKNENYDVVERLTQVIHQLEEAKEDEKLRNFKNDIQSQVNKTDTEGEMSEGKNETEPKHQKLEEPLDDDISILLKDDVPVLLEILTKLANEYQETYQNLRQHIANKYKRLQDASKYIDEQTEMLSKLTLDDSIEIEYKIQAGKHLFKGAEVHKLAEQGIDRLEIAQKTGLPIGEVDLLLSLSKPTESEN